jgi:uncharacterized protein (UPF0332 family)
MPSALTTERLNHVAKAKKAAIAAWKEGVSLERDTEKSIDSILERVASARWRLADSFRKQANRLMGVSPSLYRSAISRYYYAMYHALRACVFLENGGDDHEDHSKLPTQIPATLNPGVDWQTKMKDARIMRNYADYDAYPQGDGAWKVQAQDIKADATELLVLTKTFLISKGCTL